MNAIRIVISLFVGVLIVVAAIAWTWTAAHQPPSQALASHVVLGLAILAGVIGVIVIWRARPDGSGRRPA